MIPEEVIARDYGCGNPSEHLRAGETVLDLGSGSGKIGFIASQVVGPHGRVIGVDMKGNKAPASTTTRRPSRRQPSARPMEAAADGHDDGSA